MRSFTTEEIRNVFDTMFEHWLGFEPPAPGFDYFDHWLENYNHDLIARAIEFVDSTPAVTWTGKGGVKERLNEFVEGL